MGGLGGLEGGGVGPPPSLPELEEEEGGGVTPSLHFFYSNGSLAMALCILSVKLWQGVVRNGTFDAPLNRGTLKACTASSKTGRS